MSYILLAVSSTVSAVGTLANSVSLSYFTRSTEKSLSRKLFILLNTFDLLVCFSVLLTVVFFFCTGSVCGGDKFPFRASFALYDLSIETTAYATCLLGAVRVVSVCLPFHHINKKAVLVITVVFLCTEVFRLLFRFYIFYGNIGLLPGYIKFDNAAMIALLTVFVPVNCVCCGLLVWELMVKMRKPASINREALSKSNERATVTVVIVSACFLLFNTIFVVRLYYEIFVVTDYGAPSIFGLLTIWLAVPLNSALNPLIYFARRPSMRRYVRSLPRLIASCCVSQGSGTRPSTFSARSSHPSASSNKKPEKAHCLPTTSETEKARGLPITSETERAHLLTITSETERAHRLTTTSETEKARKKLSYPLDESEM